MFAAKNLLLSRRNILSLTASNATNVTITPSSFTGYVAGNSCLIYNVPCSVVIGSTTIASYALTFSGFNVKDKIIINNSGKIVGRGGDGNSGAGGPALNVSGSVAPVIINNLSGAIIGSGGGAGGRGVQTGVSWSYCTPPIGRNCGTSVPVNTLAAGGGGGGGQGYIGGTGGPVNGSNACISTPGSGGQFASAGGTGTITSAGTGGPGTFGFSGYLSPTTYFGAGSGGSGGSFGANGGAGQSTGSPINGGQGPTTYPSASSAGGTTGNAIKGVGLYTLNNNGNVYGPQIP